MAPQSLRKLLPALVMCCAGCHFHAGFGSQPSEVTRTEKNRDTGTVHHADGSSTTTETVVETDFFNDGRSSSNATTIQTRRDKDGNESRSTHTTTTEKAANGSTTSSTSSSS